MPLLKFQPSYLIGRFTANFLNILSFVSLFISGVWRLIISINLLFLCGIFYGKLFGNSQSIISLYVWSIRRVFSIFSPAYYGKLSGFIVWRLMMNYLFFVRPNVNYCNIYVGRLIVNYLCILSCARLPRKFSGFPDEYPWYFV